MNIDMLGIASDSKNSIGKKTVFLPLQKPTHFDKGQYLILLFLKQIYLGEI